MSGPVDRTNVCTFTKDDLLAHPQYAVNGKCITDGCPYGAVGKHPQAIYRNASTQALPAFSYGPPAAFLPDMGVASRAVGLAGVGTDFLANRWRSASEFPSGGFPNHQDRTSATEPKSYPTFGQPTVNASQRQRDQPPAVEFGFAIPRPPASAATPTDYSAIGRITENNSRLNVSGDQRATKKPRVAVESTSLDAGSASSPGVSGRQVNLPEVSQKLLNILKAQRLAMESDVKFDPSLESLPNDCWNFLHRDKRFKALRKSCTPDSEESVHQEFLTHAIGLMITFLGEKCALTLRDTSAKDYPIDPQHKVDLSFVVGLSADSPVQWPAMVFGIEIKSKKLSSHISKGLKQVCDFISQLFYTDPLRTFAPAYLMTATKLRYYEFTRTTDDDHPTYTASRTAELPLFADDVSLGFRLLLHKLIKSPAALGYSLLRTQHVVNTLNAWTPSLKLRSLTLTMQSIKEPSRAGKPCLLKLCISSTQKFKPADVVDERRSLLEFDLQPPYPSKFLNFKNVVMKVYRSDHEFDTERNVLQSLLQHLNDDDLKNVLPRFVGTLNLDHIPSMPEHAGALMIVPFAPYTLADLRGKFSPQVGFSVAHSVFRALRVIHALGRAHADISMGNILLMGDSDFPQVILNDFGASVPLGTIIGEHFITTHSFASPRVQFAKSDAASAPHLRSEIRFTLVDDYVALFFVLLEFCESGASHKISSARRLLFFQNELTHSFFAEFDSFAWFLREFHAALRPSMTSLSHPIPDAEMTRFLEWTDSFLTRFLTPLSVYAYCCRHLDLENVSFRQSQIQPNISADQRQQQP